MAGQKQGQSLFHRILPASTSGLTSTTTVEQHLKVKDREYNVHLTKHYCITVSMQKSAPFILKIKPILGSHELKN